MKKRPRSCVKAALSQAGTAATLLWLVNIYASTLLPTSNGFSPSFPTRTVPRIKCCVVKDPIAENSVNADGIPNEDNEARSIEVKNVVPSNSSVPQYRYVSTSSINRHFSNRPRKESLPDVAFETSGDTPSPQIDLAETVHYTTLSSSLTEKVSSFLGMPLVEVSLGLLVLLNSLLVAIGTLQSPNPLICTTIDNAENAIAYLFAVEFFARWYASFETQGVVRYLAQPLVLVDLLVVILPLIIPIVMIGGGGDGGVSSWIPPWLMSQSGLINLRLLRILRLQRVLVDMETFSRFEMALGLKPSEIRPYQLQLARVLLSVFTLLSVASGLIYSAEHVVNPQIPDYFTALYFGLTTLTTVGFGDIVPVTNEGKLIVCGSILAGVAIIPAQAASLVEALLASQQRSPQGPNTPQQLLPPGAVDASTPCPSCGATFHWNGATFCWSCGSKLA